VKETVEAIPEVDDAFVHVDPKELGEWKDDPETDELLGAAGEGTDESEPATDEGREDGDVDPTT
jgi:hypothetical protein